MKLYLVLVVLTVFMIGCGNTTELRWDNDSSADVREIQWLGTKGVDQEWPDRTNHGDKTNLKEVNLLTGQGECLDIDSGDTSEIWFGTARTARLTEGEANELTITRLSAKKKSREIVIDEETEIINARVISRED